MNAFPLDFQFSQNNLQDYVDCPRRFELRHLLRQEWPALQTEPVREYERLTELGQRFHEMVHQFFRGIPAEAIASHVEDVELATWWDDFIRSSLLAELPGNRRMETTLAAPLEGFRVVAKMDLVAIEPSKRAVIVDWKTASRPGSRQTLLNRLQSRVYPFLLVEVGARLNAGQPLAADQIEMVYWFTSQPSDPIRLHYSSRQHRADREYLAELIREIASRPLGQYPLTLDDKKCAFCVFRSLCDRGERAGDWRLMEDEPETQAGLEIPFEQIGEVEF